MSKELPSIEMLRQLLDYDPATGVLTWKPRPLEMFAGDVRICGTWNTRYAGKPALSHVDAHGYRIGAIHGTNYLAHRVVWKMVHGADPSGEIDHINGDRADNHIDNLRDVSKSGNQRNAARRKDNQSGTTGVYWHKVAGKWAATIGNKSIGIFDSKDEAIFARTTAQEMAGYHENHGKRKGRP